jgi:hypothetical protein
MITKSKIASIIWTILVLSINGLGQDNANSISKNELDNLLVLEAKLEKKQYTSDESLELVFTLKNETAYTIELFDAIPERSFEIKLTNEKGENIPLSKEGRKRKYPDIIMGREAVCIESGKQLQWKVDLKTLFDISKAGIYTVTVERSYFIQDSTQEQVQRNLVSSQPIQFEIMGNELQEYKTNKSQNKKSSDQSKTVQEIQLDIKLEMEIVNLTEKVELVLKVKNHSKQHIALFYELSDIFSGYEIEIKDSKNKIVPPIKKKLEGNSFGSRTKLVWLSEDEMCFKIVLSEFYLSLSAGEYSVIVKVNFIKYKDADEIESDLIRITTKPIILKVMESIKKAI